jgi:hypothetical protein
MEPERHIEKLLRAVAKKRREQTGEPFELHPAARQELLREAANRPTKKSGGGFFAQIFSAFGPRLALALSVVVIAAIGMWLVRPLLREKPEVSMLSSRSLRADRAVANNEPMTQAAAPPVSAAPTVVTAEPASDANADTTTAAAGARRSAGETDKDQLKKHPVSTLALKPPPSNKGEANRKAAVAAEAPKSVGATQPGVARDEVSESTVTAAPPPPSTPATTHQKTRVADSFVAGNAGEKNSAPTAPVFATNAIAPSMTVAAADREAQKPLKKALPQPAPMNTAQTANFDIAGNNQAAAKLASNAQRFNRVITTPTVRQRGFGGGSSITPLLASFRMEQNGQEIRVIDADGSVYTGSWQVAPEQNAPPTAAPAHEGGGLHFFGPQSAAASRAPVAPALDNNFEATLNYSFTVSGTNRNLKQKITFSGNFIPLTNSFNAANNTGVVSGLMEGRATAASNVTPPPVLLNTRIEGKAVIGGQREIQVNANPAP